MKTREEYLVMIPPHRDVEEWREKVNKAFDDKDSGKTSDEWIEYYLEKYFNSKPRTLVERWLNEAESYKREAEDKKKAEPR